VTTVAAASVPRNPPPLWASDLLNPGELASLLVSLSIQAANPADRAPDPAAGC
jgi:hypothetical protein